MNLDCLNLNILFSHYEFTLSHYKFTFPHYKLTVGFCKDFIINSNVQCQYVLNYYAAMINTISEIYRLDNDRLTSINSILNLNTRGLSQYHVEQVWQHKFFDNFHSSS